MPRTGLIVTLAFGVFDSAFVHTMSTRNNVTWVFKSDSDVLRSPTVRLNSDRSRAIVAPRMASQYSHLRDLSSFIITFALHIEFLKTRGGGEP